MQPEVTEWPGKARADLAAARFRRSNAEIPTEIVAFHDQQAAEKALKGLYVVRGDVPPHVHDLRALLSRLTDASLSLDAAEALTPFAVLSRYPGFSVTVSSENLNTFDSFAGACIRELERQASGPA